MRARANLITVFVLSVFLTCFYFGCDEGKGNPVDPDAEQSDWSILFQDNFNRADTVDNDIGDYWQINSFASSSYVKLKEGSVYCVNQPLVLYAHEINDTTIRISAKVTTKSSASTAVGLVTRASLDYSKGYVCWITKSSLKICRYDSSSSVLLVSKDISLQPNTIYFFKFRVEGVNLEGNLLNSSKETIATVKVSDSKYTTGKVGFKAGTDVEVLLDDFIIEKYEYRDSGDINGILTIE